MFSDPINYTISPEESWDSLTEVEKLKLSKETPISTIPAYDSAGRLVSPPTGVWGWLLKGNTWVIYSSRRSVPGPVLIEKAGFSIPLVLLLVGAGIFVLSKSR